jgi:hypothetical protein
MTTTMIKRIVTVKYMKEKMRKISLMIIRRWTRNNLGKGFFKSRCVIEFFLPLIKQVFQEVLSVSQFSLLRDEKLSLCADVQLVTSLFRN